MPYIKNDLRSALDAVVDAVPHLWTPGELNYLLTRIVMKFIKSKDKGISYTNCNEAIGTLECVKQELYRRVVAPYEDEKVTENGDVIDFKDKV